MLSTHAHRAWRAKVHKLGEKAKDEFGEHRVSDFWSSEESALSKQSDHAAAASAPGEMLPESEPARAAHLSFSGVRAIGANAEVAAPQIPSDADLELDFDDDAGLVLRNDEDVVWSARWAELVKCSTPERVTLSAGGRGVLLVATPMDRSPLLAVVPTDRPGRTERAIRARASQHGVKGRRSSPPAWMVAGAVAAVAAAVTVFLLAAGHALHL